jgi:choline monooxygenase
MGPRRAVLDGYTLDRMELHECNYNWKTFIEVYLEDYHVGPFHPGLGNFVTCDDLRWEFQQELFGADRGRGQPPGQPGSRCTRSGTKSCWRTAKASCPSAGPSG